MSEEDSGPRVVDEEEDAQPLLKRMPAITTGGQIRELERIIHDDAALRVLDRTRSLVDASLSSQALLQDKIDNAVEILSSQVNTLFGLSDHLTAARRRQVEGIGARVQKLLTLAPDSQLLAARGADIPAYNDLPEHHFSTLHVRLYRGLLDLKVQSLRRLNLLGGLNNAGKTSLLEAIYLLSQQSRFDASVELLQWRAHDRRLPATWLWEQLPRDISIAGTFDSRKENCAEVRIVARREATLDMDQAGYLGTVTVDARYAGQEQRTVTHIFDERPYETRGRINRVLCPALFSTPFMMHDPEVLNRLWDMSVLHKVKEKIIVFLRESLSWDDLDQIDMAKIRRFLVTDGGFEQAMDLSSYGEGVQRMFQIGLLFASARNGVVLIDEFENAIHSTLLSPFILFVDELAREFHVQVFLTTHSRECIQAFVQPELAEHVSYYALQREAARVRCEQLDGETLAQLFDATDFEPRRLL